MTRSTTPTALGLALTVALALVSTAGAESVELLSQAIVVHNLSGPTVVIDAFGSINLGGNGSVGNLLLRDTDGSLRAGLLGASADLILGGGDDDGDIVLRDTDGVTTTVNLQGEFGFIQLGSADDDGDLRLWDNDPDNEFSIDLDGGTGNVTNQLGGNGLLKAWARVNLGGTVERCFRCNADPVKTFREGVGVYRVDFDVLGADLLGRPMLCKSVGIGFIPAPILVQCEWVTLTSARVVVLLADSSNTLLDIPFEVFIF